MGCTLVPLLGRIGCNRPAEANGSMTAGVGLFIIIKAGWAGGAICTIGVIGIIGAIEAIEAVGLDIKSPNKSFDGVVLTCDICGEILTSMKSPNRSISSAFDATGAVVNAVVNGAAVGGAAVGGVGRAKGSLPKSVPNRSITGGAGAGVGAGAGASVGLAVGLGGAGVDGTTGACNPELLGT